MGYPTIKVFRENNKVVIQGIRKEPIFANKINALKIQGVDIKAQSDEKWLPYFEGDFDINFIDVYEVPEGVFYNSLGEMQNLTSIVRVNKIASLPALTNNLNWLILVCDVEVDK